MSYSNIKLAGAVSIALAGSTASAESLLTLSSPTNASMQTIGQAKSAPESKPALSLGKLRTTEAELPGEEQTYEARVALRYKREMARRQASDVTTNTPRVAD